MMLTGCGWRPNGDRQENQCSLEHGNPLFSAYHTDAGDEL
jgi:hypothetical protein